MKKCKKFYIKGKLKFKDNSFQITFRMNKSFNIDHQLIKLPKTYLFDVY